MSFDQQGRWVCAVVAGLLGACSSNVSGTNSEQAQEPFTSAEATLMNFEFDGELALPSADPLSDGELTSLIRSQLFYTIGQLNGNRSVSQLSKLTLSNVQQGAGGDGSNVHYHAVLPVAWASRTTLPTSYTFIVPRRIDSAAIQSFINQYGGACVEGDAHDLSEGSLWYYYRPDTPGCAPSDQDAVRLSATATRSNENTEGKYPEYNKIWEDHAFTMLSVFGKYEEGATSNSDAGIRAYNSFLSRIASAIPGVTSEPPGLPANPGVNQPEVTFRANLGNGRSFELHVILVDSLGSAGPDFDAKYNALSTEADLIAYNGHAGLGGNVAALMNKGQFRSGKYQIFFINGCDTFAYVDETLTQARAGLNPDDPTGTKYMEIIMNAMPSYFSSNAGADMALIQALLKPDAPVTYQSMFQGIDRAQVVVVTGEEDNTFTP